MESDYSKLEKLLRNRIDGRMDLLLNSHSFTGVVGTISGRYPEDALNIICQSMLAVLKNDELSMKKYCADLIVYGICESPEEEEEFLKKDIKGIADLMSQNEKEGFVLWLELAKNMDFGKLCKNEIDLAMRYWKNV